MSRLPLIVVFLLAACSFPAQGRFVWFLLSCDGDVKIDSTYPIAAVKDTVSGQVIYREQGGFYRSYAPKGTTVCKVDVVNSRD
jgi:hypothetical protein